MSVKTTLCVAALLSCVTFSAAQAQAPKTLSKNSVEKYYSELAGIFKKPLPDFLKQYDLRIHPDLTYVSKTGLIVPNQPRMESKPVMITKPDLIANAERAYNTAKGATLTNEVQNIVIAPDGLTATVKNLSTVKNMNFPTSDGSPMKADSKEICDDVVTLNDGIVQILKSDCATEITIHP
jgi:hypothetical protein